MTLVSQAFRLGSDSGLWIAKGRVELLRVPVNTPVSVALVDSTIPGDELTTSAQYVRRTWPHAAILLVGPEREDLDDPLYDHRVPLHISARSLHTLLLRLAGAERSRNLNQAGSSNALGRVKVLGIIGMALFLMANGFAASGLGLAFVDAPVPETSALSGTVMDTNDDLIPGATVSVESRQGDPQTVSANESGAFEIQRLKPGVPYSLRIEASGFADWTSPAIVLHPGEFHYLNNIRLKPMANSTSITVYADTTQIAKQQVRIEEQQRVLGVIPNFYVAYNSSDAVRLTPKLKFKLAMRAATDPITIVGIAMMAGINQAANTPDFQQGAGGYGQRLGTVAADGFSDIVIGGAVLPSLLHQDPRYFYQGTGSKKSRVLHALSAPFVARADDGHREINFSSLGGDIASGALAMTNYPDSNRSAERVFGTFGLATGERAINALLQEFILPRLTTRGRPKSQAK